jgi:formylglycine-generating enzyme required for sulfatase activity
MPLIPSRVWRLLLVVAMLALGSLAPVRGAVDFESQIKPIIEAACLRCHNEHRADGDLRLDTYEGATDDGGSGPAVVPGNADESLLYSYVMLPEDDSLVMPPEGGRLDKSQTDRLKQWIEEGANWPKDIKLEVQPRIDFVKLVQPILEMNCLSCHSADHLEGDFDLSTHTAALETGSNPPSIVPFKPQESSLYTLTVISTDDPLLMPPSDQGGPLSKDDTEILRLWIAQGAVWPEGVTLKTRPRPPSRVPSPDNLELVRKLHAVISAKAAEENGKMADYSAEVPQTGATYHMVAIKGGKFTMGSPESEPGRHPSEGPQKTVEVGAFWMGKYEVTWDEYEPFMVSTIDRYKNGARKDFDPKVHSDVDAVSAPTAPYTEMSFGMGQRGFPAISMTQHAANKYCQWLSAQTGHFYRLPTEAEWEYACRAGTTSAWSFGDDPELLDEYAWYIDNSNEKYQKVGQKKPNPWGLHDMHGNVMEWCADQYVPDYFERLVERAQNPYIQPQTLYPRSVRGGGWEDDPEQTRSAFRRGSEPHWKQQDPQLPKSIWYLTDAPWLGFRLVRPQEVPSVEEMYFYWNSATDKL